MRSCALLLCSAALIVACSSSGDRAGFGDTSSSSSSSGTPQPTATPTGTATEPPPDPPPPEPDTCVRTPPSKACGVFPQCGCAASETCDVGDTDGNAECVPFGKTKMGAACTHTVGCAKGLTCVFGTCHAFCGAAGACGQPGTGDCIQVTLAGGGAVPNLSVCLVACALQDPMSCGGTTSAGTGVCVLGEDGKTDCQIGSTRGLNQACTDECGPGLVCAVPSGQPSGTCKRWCRVGSADCGGQTCGSFSPPATANGVEYGRCP